MPKFENLDLNAVKNLAIEVASAAKVSDVYLLYGGLGVGKTTFTQFFAQHLGAELDEVSSPTFNLVHVYNAKDCKIWHFDLYRLKAKEEIYELGLDDALSTGITIIEWPDIAEDMLPSKAIKLYFSTSPSPSNPELRDVSTKGWDKPKLQE
jgi:tRNA threonylcarbamoyladenosine biosynthesis protein TsaE